MLLENCYWDFFLFIYFSFLSISEYHFVIVFFPAQAPTTVKFKANINSCSSMHKKSLGRPNLTRSTSGASDSHCLTVRYSRSVESPKFSATASNSRSHSFKQRHLNSTSDHAVVTNKKKLSTDFTKLDNTSATPSSSEINKKLIAESTTSEIPR